MLVHGQGHAKRQVCSWSRAFVVWARPKYWPQCPSWIRVLTGQSVPFINLEEPGLYSSPRSVQAGVKYGSQTHGFKPGVAVKNTRDGMVGL